MLLLLSGQDAKATVLVEGDAPQTDTSQKPTLKEQVMEIPPGTMVEACLRTKEKVRGRLGEVSDEGLVLKVAKSDKTEDRKVTFDELKSIKKFESKKVKVGKTAGYIGLGYLALLGAVALILVVASR